MTVSIRNTFPKAILLEILLKIRRMNKNSVTFFNMKYLYEFTTYVSTIYKIVKKVIKSIVHT